MCEEFTLEQAIDFCKDRIWMHNNGAVEVSKKFDIIEDEISRAKYNNHVGLANKYATIAGFLMILKKKMEEEENNADDRR